VPSNSKSAVSTGDATGGGQTCATNARRAAPWIALLLQFVPASLLVAQDAIPPADVVNLMVNRTGADVVLSWSPVTTNLLGTSKNISGYRVYRGTAPDFIPDKTAGSNLIGIPAAPSFTDAGAAGGAQNYFYLVSAVGAAGDEGNTRPTTVLTPPVTTGSFSTTAANLNWTGAAPAPAIGGYKVLTGAAHASYSALLDVGNVTAAGIYPLAVGTTHYLAVMAYDTRGNLSAPSNEISGALVSGGGPTSVCNAPSADTTWTVAGSPYVVTCNMVLAGPTLTIQPGVIVKFAAGAGITFGFSGIPGGLVAQGTASSPIVFTSNLAAPAPGDWRGLEIEATTSATVLDHVAVEYGGSGPRDANVWIGTAGTPVRNSTIQFSDGDGIGGNGIPILEDNRIRNNASHGIFLSAPINQNRPTVQRNVIQENGSYPMHLEFVSFPLTLAGNSYIGNAIQAIEIGGGNSPWAVSIPNESLPYVVTSTLQMNNGFFSGQVPSLTLVPGVTLKFNPGTGLDIGGNPAFGTLADLVAQGTAAQPITLTSASAGPAPGQWNGINLVGSTSATLLDHVVVEYAGAGVQDAGITVGSVNGPIIRNSTIRSSDGRGVVSSGATVLENDVIQNNGSYGVYQGAVAGSGRPSLQGCQFSGNGSYPLHLEFLSFPSTISGNTWTGNAIQAIELAGGNLALDTTIPDAGAPYIVTSSLQVNSGVTSATPILTLQPGVTLKFPSSTGIDVGYLESFGYLGVLRAQGTAAQPITLTSASATPAPGQWNGITMLGTTPATLLDHVVVEYAGAGSQDANISIGSSTPAVTNSTIRFSDGRGIVSQRPCVLEDNVLQGNASYGISLGTQSGAGRASIQRNTFTGNGSYPLHVEFPSFPVLAANQYNANGVQAIELAGGGILADLAIPTEGLPYVVTSSLGVNNGISTNVTPTLTLAPGLTLKFVPTSGLDIGYFEAYGARGILVAQGSAAQPITLTTASPVPAPGQWNGVTLYGTTPATVLDHVVIEYAGGMAQNANLWIVSSTPTLRYSTIRYSDGLGISIGGGRPRIVLNAIVSNALDGLDVTPTSVASMPAQLNFWGDASGPGGSGTGTGNGVNQYVRYEPWLAAPPSEPFEWQDAADSPDPMSQLGSWASFRGLLPQAGNWTIEFRDSGGALVRHIDGSGATVAADWYGDNDSGTPLPNGTFRYEMKATSVTTGQQAIAAAGQITLNNGLPIAKIAAPSFGAMFPAAGGAAVTGSAGGASFQSYLLEYGSGDAPLAWTPIATSTAPVSHGTLANWNTSALTDPVYSLRLTVTASGGPGAGDQTTTSLLSFRNPAAAPNPFSPNGDGRKDTSVIGASLSYPSNWTVGVRNASNAVVRIYSGSGFDVAPAWDGKDAGGQTLPTGPYTFTIQATEPLSGVSSSTTGSLTLDNVPPIAAITAPAADQTVYEIVPVTGSANDAIGLASYVVEFGAGDPAPSYTAIGSPQSTPVSNGLLAQWPTENLVSAGPGEPALLEQWIPNGVYTLRLTSTDLADNVTTATVRVDSQNLYLENVAAAPISFDPVTGGSASITGVLSLAGRMTAEIFARDSLTGSTSRVRLLADDQLFPAGPFNLTWYGTGDGGNVLPFTYYTFKLSAHTAGGERTALYDRFFKYGGFTNADSNTWLRPVQPVGTEVASGFRLDYNLAALSRIALEAGGVCPSHTFTRFFHLNEPQLPGAHSLFWDLSGIGGQDVADGCPFGFSYFATALNSYPLPENTLITTTPAPQVLSFSYEPLTFKPATGEIVTVAYNLDTNADTVSLQVLAPNRTVFRTISGLPATSGEHSFEWDGLDDSGRVPVGQGPYTLALNVSKDRSGIVVGSGREGHVVLLGDYHVDEAGRRIFQPLGVIEGGGQLRLLFVTSVVVPR